MFGEEDEASKKAIQYLEDTALISMDNERGNISPSFGRLASEESLGRPNWISV